MGKPPQRALVRGRRAEFWFIESDVVFLRHPNGRDEAEIPVSHFGDDDAMDGHYRRLGHKRWVAPGAIDELKAIVAGGRR